MPSNIVKSFAKKTGKSEAEVEKLWDQAIAAAKKQYPDKEGDDLFPIVTDILKKMVGLKESTESFEDILKNEYDELDTIKSSISDKDDDDPDEDNHPDEE